MNFSKTASYSLNVLSYMAANVDKRMSATFLHEKLSIPYPYLRQVLRSLSRNGFIKSTKGRSGGFSFGRDKSEIFLSDIIEATDGMDSLNKCILGFSACPLDAECPMHSIWEVTRISVIKVLKETSLAQIIR